jgi:hypothetical protein
MTEIVIDYLRPMTGIVIDSLRPMTGMSQANDILVIASQGKG